MNHLGRALTEYDDPPVNVLFVYNCNPAATVPDQRRVLRGLEREDLFTVVFEQVMTDTALYADVVLPATTFLEGYDFAKAYGPIHLDLAPARHRRGRRGAIERRRVRRAVRAAGAARGRRADAGELDLLVRVLDALPGHDRRRPARGRAAVAAVRRRADPVRRRLSEHAGPQGRSVPRRARRERADRPLSLSARSGDRRVSARAHLARQRAHDQLDARRAAAARRQAARCTPTMRSARGLADGDLVRVFNDLGEVHCTLNVSVGIRPGTVSLPKGLWRRSTRNGFTGTALVPDTLTDLGGGACFNDARVQVASLATA